MNECGARDRRYRGQWVAFYLEQGYTEPQSEILAEQVCGGYGRGYRITVDEEYGVFRKSRKHFRGGGGRFQESISLKDISRAISRALW